jgi:hypothetical protein
MPRRQLKYSQQVSVRLTERQHNALRAYCEYVDLPVGVYGRQLLTQGIPAEFWEREKPPPGQLEMEVDE